MCVRVCVRVRVRVRVRACVCVSNQSKPKATGMGLFLHLLHREREGGHVFLILCPRKDGKLNQLPCSSSKLHSALKLRFNQLTSC